MAGCRKEEEKEGLREDKIKEVCFLSFHLTLMGGASRGRAPAGARAPLNG